MLDRGFLTSLALVTTLCITALSACKKEEPTLTPQTLSSDADAAPTPKLSSEGRPIERTTKEPQFETKPKPILLGETQTEKVKYVATVTADPMNPIDAVEFTVSRAWSEIRSISAKVKTIYDQRGEFERHFEGVGTNDFVKVPGKILTKLRLATSMRIKQKSKKVPWILTGQRLTVITDGRYMYTLDERHEGKMATKRFPLHMRVRYLGGSKLFKFIRSMKNLKQLPDEAIGDKYAYAFEGEFPRVHLAIRHYLDKETGILLKMVVEDEANQSTFVAEFFDFELNVEFPESHFDFTTPEGIEIQDLTIPGSVPKPPTAD